MEEPEPENSSTIIGAEKEEMEIGKDEKNKITNVEEDQENTEVEDENEMAEEDDDDFGDFEEAPIKIEDAEENSEISTRKGSSPIQLQITAPLSIPPIFHKAIREIIEEPTIWQCSSASDGLKENFLNQTLPSPFDLFPRLDAGSLSDEDSTQFTDEFMLKAHRFWTQICYLEEARALKFKWDAASLTYQRILWTLDLQGKSKARKHPMQREKQSKKKEEAGGIGQLASSKSTNAIGEQQRPSTSDGMNPSAQPPQIDSLMVPPADFDWRKSGLANPLTAQAVSLSAPAFDSNFFLENQSTPKTNGIDAPMNPPVNSASILAGDLAALGLGSNSEELEPARTSMNSQLNGGLSMLDAGMLVKMGNLGGGIDGKQNKLVATLTQMEGGNGQQSG